MFTKTIPALAALCALALLSACGSNDGVKLGEFPAIKATEGDAPITLKAPTSASPAPFTFTSSDQRVATIVGDKLTVGVAGTSTITAQQGQSGSYNPTSASTTLTVAQRVCPAPSMRENGACVPVQSAALYVLSGVLNWTPVSFAATWAEADAYCKAIKAYDVTGWRLPSQFELTALAATGRYLNRGWILADTWTTSAGAAEKQHVAVNLETRVTSSLADDNKAYVTCVN